MIKFKKLLCSYKDKILASTIMSLNHKIIALAVKINPNNNSSPPNGNPWKYITALIAIVNKVKLVTNGQGDCSTKWKAKDWNLLLCVEIGLLKLVI